MKKVNKKKGFTLAELLVVIAILAILVAIAAPIFTGVLTNARDQVMEANLRAAQSAAMVDYLTTTPMPTGAMKYTYTVDPDTKNIELGTPEAAGGATSAATDEYSGVVVVGG